MPRIFPAVLAAALTLSAAAAPPGRPWNHDVIYFALTDRFLDGENGGKNARHARDETARGAAGQGGLRGQSHQNGAAVARPV